MPKARILVVEDEAITARHIQRALEKAGYDVPNVVAYGEEAIKLAEELKPDLVLMDIMLKGDMDGVQAAEQIRTRFGLPVVYLTANSDGSTISRAKITEPLGYIIKPFDERSLHTTIEMALYKHEIDSKITQRSEELEALYAVSRILAQPWSFEEKSKAVLEALAMIASADMATMRVFDASNNSMTMVCSAGPANWSRPERLPANQSISGIAFNTREPVNVSNYPSHQLIEPTALAQGIQSLVSIPIRAEQHTLGVVNLLSTKTDNFPPRLVNLLSGIADGLGTL